MKRILPIVILIIIAGCKSKSDELSLLEGSYIYFDDAAVLQTKNEIYGVFLNEKAMELNNKAKAYKSNPNNFIYVKVKGIVSTKKDEKILWEKKLEIVEIESINSTNELNKSLILGSNWHVKDK